MPVFKNSGGILATEILEDETISWKAKGILTYLLSLPEQKEMKLSELSRFATDGKTSLKSGLEELEEAGYLICEKNRKDNGQFNSVYKVLPEGEKPARETREGKSVLGNFPSYQQSSEEGEKNGTTRVKKEKEKTTTKKKKISHSLKEKRTKKKEKEKNVELDESDDNPPYEKIVSYLNEKANRRFSPKAKNTKKLINGRYSDGYKFKDFVEVIDKKVADWLDDKKMSKFLRPDTLFRPTNFENYINEPWPDSTSQEKPKNKQQEYLEKLSEIERKRKGG